MTQQQAAAEAAGRLTPNTEADFRGGRGVVSSLKLEVLRLAQSAGAPNDPGHSGTPDEVVDRANTYWDWMQQ